MRPADPPGSIVTWRSGDLPDLELRLGTAVSEPYPRHWHEELSLCLATDGGGVLDYRGAGHATPRASLFIVHPGEVHANAADRGAGCSFRSMYVPVATARRMASDIAGRPTDVPFFPRPVLLDGDLVRRFAELHRTLESPGARLAAGSLLFDLFVELVARQRCMAAPRAVGRERSAVRRVREHLDESYAENVSLGSLARIAGLSVFHLTRVFSDEVGMPPHAYQMQVRILRAKKLIRAGEPLAAVAAATGFADQSHFSRRFRRLVKLTPGGYARGARTYKIAAAGAGTPEA